MLPVILYYQDKEKAPLSGAFFRVLEAPAPRLKAFDYFTVFGLSSQDSQGEQPPSWRRLLSLAAARPAGRAHPQAPGPTQQPPTRPQEDGPRAHQHHAARGQPAADHQQRTRRDPRPGAEERGGGQGEGPAPAGRSSAGHPPRTPQDAPGGPQQAREGDRPPEGHHRARSGQRPHQGRTNARRGHRDGRAARHAPAGARGALA